MLDLSYAEDMVDEINVLPSATDSALGDFVHAHNQGEGDGIIKNAGGIQILENILDSGGIEHLDFGFDAHVLDPLGRLDEPFSRPHVDEFQVAPGGGHQRAVQRAHLRPAGWILHVQYAEAVIGLRIIAGRRSRGILNDDAVRAAFGADPTVDLRKDLSVVAAFAVLVTGMDVHDGRAGIVAIVGGLDDLRGLLGQVGILRLPLEVSRLSNGQDDLSFFVCHNNTPFRYNLAICTCFALFDYTIIIA